MDLLNPQDVAAIWFAVFFIGCAVVGTFTKLKEVHEDETQSED